jgi:hypothetical protein
MPGDDGQDGPGGADPVLMRLQASPPRRLVAAGMLGTLGTLLVYVAAAHPPQGVGWALFVMACGAVALFLAIRLWQASGVALELTATELREAGGRRLARLSEVRSVNRGTFAVKPSNGFLLVLERPAPAVWAPGLWWRIGRRVGVGGVTGRQAGRAMADAIAALLARR